MTSHAGEQGLAPDTRNDSHANKFAQLVLGESSPPITTGTRAEIQAAAIALASQAQRSLHIFSRDLDAPVYNNPPFIDAATRLATRSRYSFICILLQDAGRVVRHGHRLMDLIYRLDSKIKLRKPHPDYQNLNEAFLIADETGVVHRRPADRYEGTVDFSARRRARDLIRFFNEAWERSAPDPDLRRLHL